MQAASRRRWAIVLVFVTPALWAFNSLVARLAPGLIEPYSLALLRWLFAGMAFAYGARAELCRQRTQLVLHWKHNLILGTLGMAFCGAWVYVGGRTTTVLNISLIYALSPVLIAALSALWLKEALNRWQALGIGLALAGVLNVVLKGQWSQLSTIQWVAGDAWIAAATASWTAYCLLLKRWQIDLTASARLAAISLSGVLMLLPFALSEYMSSGTPAVTPEGLGLAVFAAALPGYAAYLAFSVMQRELGAARVGVSMYLSPLYAAALGWLLLGESLHPYHALGLILVLPGIYLVTRPR